MWEKSFSKSYKNLSKEKIWDLWSSIESWPTWNEKLDYCKPMGPFEKGCQFILKPKAGPKATISIVDLKKGEFFTDCTKFPGAKMYGHHQMIEENGKLRLTTSMSISGPLSFLWRKIVAEKVALSLEAETEKLAELTTNDR